MTKDFNPETAMCAFNELEGTVRGTTLDLTPEEGAENKKRLYEMYSKLVAGSGVRVSSKGKKTDD